MHYAEFANCVFRHDMCLPLCTFSMTNWRFFLAPQAAIAELRMYVSKTKEYKSENERLANELANIKKKYLSQKQQNRWDWLWPALSPFWVSNRVGWECLETGTSYKWMAQALAYRSVEVLSKQTGQLPCANFLHCTPHFQTTAACCPLCLSSVLQPLTCCCEIFSKQPIVVNCQLLMMYCCVLLIQSDFKRHSKGSAVYLMNRASRLLHTMYHLLNWSEAMKLFLLIKDVIFADNILFIEITFCTVLFM